MFNSQIRPALAILLRLVTCFLFFLCHSNWQTAAHADSLEDATRNLARKTAAAVRGGIASLDQRNLSSLKETEFTRLRAVFRDELQRQGVKLSPNPGDVKIVLTLTGRLTGFIGVAQIQRGASTITEMESLGRPADSTPGVPSAGITLHKEFLLAQDMPIVDVVFSVDRKQAYALGLQEILSYERKGEQWVLNATERLPTHGSMNREMRGFLEFGADREAVFLPGEVCRNFISEDKGWHCEFSREPMPARAVLSNAITEKKSPPWFSAALLEEAGHADLILTGRDGVARLYEDGADPVATYSEWGSELASVRSGCGRGWQILVTGKGDWTTSDTIQAIELQDHVVQSVSQAMEFGGPVIALHNPSSKDPADAADAVAIVHDLETGRYEAYRLTLTCGS